MDIGTWIMSGTNNPYHPLFGTTKPYLRALIEDFSVILEDNLKAQHALVFFIF